MMYFPLLRYLDAGIFFILQLNGLMLHQEDRRLLPQEDQLRVRQLRLLHPFHGGVHARFFLFSHMVHITIHNISTSIENPSTCCHQKIYVFYIEFPSLLIADLISITCRL